MYLIRGFPIFASASGDLLEEVAQNLREVRLDPGEVICRQGEEGGVLYFIRSGQVRVSIRSVEGVEETLRFLGPGDYFGEMSVMTGEPISADVTTTLPTDLSVLDGDRFNEICEKHPLLYREVAKTVSRRLRETNQQRIVSCQGKVTRFGSISNDVQQEVVFSTLITLAEALCVDGERRPLCIVPIPSDRMKNESTLHLSGLIPEGVPRIEVREHVGEEQLSAFFMQAKLELGGIFHRWYRFAERWDLLLLDLLKEQKRLDRSSRLNSLLSSLRPIYSHILVSHLDLPLESLLEQRIPGDNIAFFADLTAEGCQREATREEYDRYVPEGSRYPPQQGETYWALKKSALSRLQEFAGSLERLGVSNERLRLLLLHRAERPVLDYAAVRRIFPRCSIHPIPLGTPSTESPRSTEAPSAVLALAENRAEAIGRVTRNLAGRQVALALGGGGARGLAHIGVIRVLEEAGIPIDLVAGSSMGSVTAAAYAEGRPARRLEADMRLHWAGLGNFLLDFLDYTFPRTSLLRGRKIRKMIDRAMEGVRIEECQIPLYVVCADLITGREIVLEEGPLGEAARASGSLPGIFRPVWWKGHLLVDGAVLSPVPIRVLQQHGARTIIAVNVTAEREEDLLPKTDPGRWRRWLLERFSLYRNMRSHPNIVRILSRSLTISGLNQSRIQSEAVDIEIKPKIEHFDFLRFDQFDEIVEAGAEAAREAIPEIRRLIARTDSGAR